MNAVMKWSGTHWVVVISDGEKVIECPLDEFIELPAIKGIRQNAVEEARNDSATWHDA